MTCPRPCVRCVSLGLQPVESLGSRDPDREEAAHAIRKLVEERKIHPFDINHGDCEEFALDLVNYLGRGAEEFDLSEYDLAHTCVLFRGRYYDAEEPYGVKHWNQLPIAMRHARE